MRIHRRKQYQIRLPYNAFTRHAKYEFYKALENRIPITRACQLAGFSLDTYYNWMDRGKDPRQLPYYYFRKKVLRIRARVEQESLDIIRQSAKGGASVIETKVQIGGRQGRVVERKKKVMLPSWEAAAWYLARAFPKEYSHHAVLQQEDERSPHDIAREIRNALEDIEGTVPEDE